MKVSGLIPVVVVSLFASVAVARADGPTVKHTTTTTVEVHDNFFDPRSAVIDKGETVRWDWRGKGRHNVVFKKVPTGVTKRRIKGRSDGQVSRSFTVAGNYRYVCTLYDGMEGTITVND